MKRQLSITLFVAISLAIFVSPILAASSTDEDTDTRMVDAVVVEVTRTRISVIARTGVEHVIAINDADTKVKIDDQVVSLKDVREGDIVTVELDENNPLKFARNIVIAVQAGNQVARVRR